MANPDTAQQMFEMFQRMLNPMALPMQSLLFPHLSGEELERKIAELKSVENWLTANLSMLQLSIKTMEYQRSLLKGDDGAKGSQAPFANPAFWPWNTMPGAAGNQSDEPKKGEEK